MQPEDLAVCRKHVLWALRKASAALNDQLADQAVSSEVQSLENALRQALQSLARIDGADIPSRPDRGSRRRRLDLQED